MGRKIKDYLDCNNIYNCLNCGTHLSSKDQILSKAFHGRGGKAYLFHLAINVSVGPLEQRNLLTGMHTVCDIFCNGCGECVGWKYHAAEEEREQYKVGKFILEKTRLGKEDWEKAS